MTPLAAKDVSGICRAHLTGEGRWVSLALSLGGLTSGNRFVVSAEHLLYEIEGADEQARQYDLLNWQGGVISGARYAFRALKAPTQQVCLRELRGRLSSGDVWAVSAAASLAVSRLLGRPEVLLDLGGWEVQEDHRQQAAEDVSRSPVSGRTDTDQVPQDIPAEPDAVEQERKRRAIEEKGEGL